MAFSQEVSAPNDKERLEMKKLLIVVNHDWFFLSHRKDIAVAAKNAGWNVTIVSCNTGRFGDIKALGLKAIDLPIDATGMNPTKEMKTFGFLWKLYRREKPEVVHHVGLKTILWGGLAAKLAGVNVNYSLLFSDYYLNTKNNCYFC